MAIDTQLDNIKYLRNHTLTTEQIRVYDAFSNAIARRASRPGYYSNEGISNDSMNQIIQAVTLDNPQYIEINFFRRRRDSNLVDPNDLNFFKVDPISREDTKRIENIVKKLQTETKNMNDLDKAMHIFKYLAKLVTYDDKAAKAAIEGKSFNQYLSSFSMVGALINKKAVCQGISLAYEYLLTKCGIKTNYIQPCYLNDVGHCFNVIIYNDKQGEHFINVDLTLSMRRDRYSSYVEGGKVHFAQNMWGFGVSTDILESLGYRMMYSYNRADDQFSYLRRNNLVFDDFPSLRLYIKRQANKHDPLTFSYHGSYGAEEMRRMLYNLAELQGFKNGTRLFCSGPFYCFCGGDYYD